MSSRLVTIVGGAISLVELGIVVVQWTTCSAQAPQLPEMTVLPPATPPPAPTTKRVELADLAEPTFDRKYLSGKAEVPGDWPDGFQPLDILGGLDGVARITSGGRAITLIEPVFKRSMRYGLTIRAGTEVAIDYRSGRLECTLPVEGPVQVRVIETQPPLAELQLVEREHATPHRELRARWTSSTPATSYDSAYLPLCILGEWKRAVVEERLTIPMPPRKGQRIVLDRFEPSPKMSVNESSTIDCDFGRIRVVAFEGVPESASLAADAKSQWIAARIPGTSFGVTCTRGDVDVHVARGLTGDIVCTLGDDTLRCPSK